jgi:hypothetical protein
LVQTAIDRSKLDQRWQLEGRKVQTELKDSVPRRAAQRMPMWLFVADGLRVLSRRPVEVEVVRDGDSVELNCERLHVFASGDSYDAALSDLHEQVVHFFRHYTSHRLDEFIGGASDLWRLYNGRFEVTNRP